MGRAVEGIAVAAPPAICLTEAERPWVDTGRGSRKQMLQVFGDSGTFITRDRFDPGFRSATHQHTGTVHAFTVSGRWRYLEYDFVATSGSYVHEPAGSVHTLDVPDDNSEPTEVLFVVEGGLLILGADGSIASYLDGPTQMREYVRLCREQGLPEPSGVSAP